MSKWAVANANGNGVRLFSGTLQVVDGGGNNLAVFSSSNVILGGLQNATPPITAYGNVTLNGQSVVISGGNLIIAAPASGIGITANGNSGSYAGNFIGNGAQGQSFGLKVGAGTNAADSALFVQNILGNQGLRVNGLGNTILGPPVSGDTLTVNAVVGANCLVAAASPGYAQASLFAAAAGQASSISLAGNGGSFGSGDLLLQQDGSGNSFFNNATAAGSVTFKSGGNILIKYTQNSLGFYGASPTTKPAVGGSRAGNGSLASLLTALAQLGLITDNSGP